ncbi:hypothetical protein TSUD_144620 [Trifolium subterraneum]|uniref:Uncharacterized protein n=1 Tax=Trifolium subterraneum TaxID=3900 RepID=A0A2Z6MRX5_TRISU|nr:hypothetical protein TSUD_144620 [Trifolium subterraneum]
MCATSSFHSPGFVTHQHAHTTNLQNTNTSIRPNKSTLQLSNKNTPLSDITASVVNRQTNNERSSAQCLSTGRKSHNAVLPPKPPHFPSIQVNLANKFNSVNSNLNPIPQRPVVNDSQSVHANQNSKRKQPTSVPPDETFVTEDSSESSEDDQFEDASESDTDDEIESGLMSDNSTTSSQGC